MKDSYFSSSSGKPHCTSCGKFVSKDGLYYGKWSDSKHMYIFDSRQPECYRTSYCWSCVQESGKIRVKYLESILGFNPGPKSKAKIRAKVKAQIKQNLEKDIARREKSTAWGKQPEKAVNYNRNNRKKED